MRLVMAGCDNCQALFYKQPWDELASCPRCGWETGLPGDDADAPGLLVALPSLPTKPEVL